MTEEVSHTQPFEFLLGQKISVIRSIHRGPSKTIDALEIETKHGRVVHFLGSEVTIGAGAVTAGMLPAGDANALLRIDLTERLSFAFRSDQRVVRVENLQANNRDQTNVHGWQVCFSSDDYFVMFHREGAVDIVCNELP
ncbi:MAG: hypothetical protein O7E57_04155 [Gammaproteobacteria bacterium]|nr:hypothetical protein [Gammaproteobacteria bacterium]